MWRKWLSDPDLVSQLQTLGVVPSTDGLLPSNEFATLVDWLMAAWAKHSLKMPAPKVRRVQRIIAALKSLNPHETILETLLIDQHRERIEHTTQGALLWRTGKLPAGRKLAIMSSRLGRDAEVQRLWLRELKCVVEWAQTTQRALITVEGTTAAKPIERMAKLRDVPLIVLKFASAPKTGSSWFEQVLIASAEEDPCQSSITTVYVSPSLKQPSRVDDSSADAESDHVDQDRLLMLVGDDHVAIKLRSGSTTERLIKARIIENAKSSGDAGECWLSAETQLVSSKTAAELLGLGARLLNFASRDVAWLEPTQTLISNRFCTERSQLVQANLNDNSWEFLAHWTRAAECISLQKLTDEELDSLLMSDETCDRSAFGVLRKILLQRRIRASKQTIRGPVPVVCFSAIPLRQLAKQRTFRAHRGRWDFEHYGLCIRRDALCKLGARPVIYGTATEFEALNDADKPWFQKRTSTSRTSQIDWSIEQEWRLPGDVDLTLISQTDAFVFVRFESEVSLIASVCEWPVISIESLAKQGHAT